MKIIMLMAAGAAFVLLCPADGWAQLGAQSGQPCPRYTPGSTIVEPEDLFSSRGVLRINLTYLTRIDASGNTLYCFVNSDGAQSPTLHVQPGDRLIISFKNGLPASQSSSSIHSMPGMIVTGSASNTCGAVVMDNTSANIHYHGTNTSPTCHQDEVIRTLVNSGQSFQYDLKFPKDEPPGHPARLSLRELKTSIPLWQGFPPG